MGKEKEKKSWPLVFFVFRGRKILLVTPLVEAIMHAILHCYVMKNEWREILSVMTLNL